MQLPVKLPKLSDSGHEASKSGSSAGGGLAAQPSLRQMLLSRALLPGAVEGESSIGKFGEAFLTGMYTDRHERGADTGGPLMYDEAFLAEQRKVRWAHGP